MRTNNIHIKLIHRLKISNAVNINIQCGRNFNRKTSPSGRSGDYKGVEMEKL